MVTFTKPIWGGVSFRLSFKGKKKYVLLQVYEEIFPWFLKPSVIGFCVGKLNFLFVQRGPQVVTKTFDEDFLSSPLVYPTTSALLKASVSMGFGVGAFCCLHAHVSALAPITRGHMP